MTVARWTELKQNSKIASRSANADYPTLLQHHYTSAVRTDAKQRRLPSIGLFRLAKAPLIRDFKPQNNQIDPEFTGSFSLLQTDVTRGPTPLHEIKHKANATPSRNPLPQPIIVLLHENARGGRYGHPQRRSDDRLTARHCLEATHKARVHPATGLRRCPPKRGARGS